MMPPRKPARMVSAHVALDGPVFDPDLARELNDAIAEGIEEMAELGADILTQFVSQAGFIDTGSFIGSIEVDMRRKAGTAGYAKVAPSDAWPNPGRPTRTWFERGTRGGVKLRRGGTGFSRTRTRLNALDPGQFFDRRIEAVLN